ncbi:MAG: hypothetical protein RIS47_215 [Bacteroidota bacterium]|jgi:drug/metabolite transporter (DMT)-like permease
MIYILLNITSSTLIILIFNLSQRFKVEIFPIVIINYYIAASIGLAYWHNELPPTSTLIHKPWIPMAIVVGILFVVMFFVIGRATRQVGVSITTVSAKMSVVFPILFSLLYYHENLSTNKILGIPLAILAVLLLTYKPKTLALDTRYWYVPIILFAGAGLVDTLVKYIQGSHPEVADGGIFSGTLFLISASFGTLIAIARRSPIRSFLSLPTLLSGTLLGIVNFGSLYFLMQALSQPSIDSSIVFGLVNIGTVLASVAIALLVLHEKLHTINWLGVGLSLLAIVLLSNP